jgi:hypothetical protein
MYSSHPSTDTFEQTDSVDTESLLSRDELQEKRTNYLPSTSTTSKRQRCLTTYLHIVVLAAYSIIGIILFVWSTRLNSSCGCESTAVYSPAQTAVQYKRQTIVHNLKDDGAFRGPPRPELDEAWGDLLKYNNLRLSGEDLQRANLTSVSLNDEQGGYLASLDVFHTLHCVNKIRKMYYSEYYHDPNPLADQQEHFDHCIDLLRQVIMCHGDVSLHTYSWIDELRVPWPSMQTEHQCRKWDTLMEWSEEHHIPDLTGPILTHPTLGVSYRGDEPT